MSSPLTVFLPCDLAFEIAFEQMNAENSLAEFEIISREKEERGED